MRHQPAVLALLAVAACDGRSDAPTLRSETEAFEGSLSPVPQEGSEVVAEVNQAKIYVADVERQAQARHISAREALAELVEFELLAQEAQRRGHADSPEAIASNKAERARRLIETVFARSFDGPEDVPYADVERTWNRIEVRSMWDHEEYHNVSFVRANAGDKATPAEDEKARQIATEMYEATRAARPSTKEEFRRLAVEIGQDRGVELAYDDFSTTRHGRAVEAFAAAAFTLTQHGEISAPTRTRWGWDVLYLDSILPAVHLTLPQVAGEIRQKLFESARRLAFLSWADGFVRARRVQRNDAWLPRIAVTSPLGQP
jgi:peptidyl-prolyl cis-trans isomerase C